MATTSQADSFAGSDAGISVSRQRCASLRHIARAWAETVESADRAEAAATFALRAMDAYGRASGNGRPDSPPCSWRQPEAEVAQSFGEAAAGLPMREALHWMTSIYSALLPASVRGKLGAFYTPPALAARLFDQAEEAGLDWTRARILDPAAGGAVFLVEAIARIRAALGPCEPKFLLSQIATRLCGIELDPRAARVGQRAIELALSDVAAKAGRVCPQLIVAADSLEAEASPEFDLVIGNPPYGRTSLSEDRRDRFRRSLYGHANLYGLFTDLALQWTRPGGIVAFLTPTSVLSGQYFRALRALLAEEAPPVTIDFVHARRGVFEDVQQETMLAVYRKGGAAGRAQIHYLYVESATNVRIVRNGTVALPEWRSGPWLAPREPAHSRLIANAAAMPNRLADLGYRVATGPLVWNRFKSQLRDRPGPGRTHPLIWAEAVTTGGKFHFRAEKKNHSLFFALEAGDDWLLVRDAAVLVQRTTAKEQRRRLIAAELPAAFVEIHGGVLVENHLNMIVPTANPKVPAAVLARLLNSDILDQLFRCMSGSVAVSAFELEALPMPPAKALAALAPLLGGAAPEKTIEDACVALYGLTE